MNLGRGSAPSSRGAVTDNPALSHPGSGKVKLPTAASNAPAAWDACANGVAIARVFQFAQRYAINELQNREWRKISFCEIRKQHFWYWDLASHQPHQVCFFPAQRSVVLVNPQDDDRQRKRVQMHLEIGIAIPAAERFEGSDASSRKGALKHPPAEIRIQGSPGFQAAPAGLLGGCDVWRSFHIAVSV